jgi:hypothetical protein
MSADVGPSLTTPTASAADGLLGHGGAAASSSSSSSSHHVIEYWEPSYRTRPTESSRFVPRAVELLIREVMERQLRSAVFDDATCKVMALELCSEIKERVKALNLPRYKVVLQSVLGEVKGQGAYIASRCLWDTDTDNYAAFSMKNASLFCVIMVFGLYLE